MGREALSATPSDADVPATFPGPGAARGPGRGPALVVLGIVATITVGGGVATLLTGSGHARHQRAAARAAGLSAEPARAALAPILHSGQPPRGVLGRLVVPRGWRRTGSSCPGDGVGLYDCQVELRLAANPPTVLAFFEHELARLGWSRLSVSPTDHGLGTELLDQVASSDGFYWDVGVFVDPDASSTAPAGGSTVEVRVVERDVGS